MPFNQYPGGDMNFEQQRSRFVAISAEAGLASTDAATAYSATVGCFNCFNSADASDRTESNIIIHPVKLILRAQAVNTSATDMRLHFVIDASNRYTSGGTQLTPVAAHGTKGGTITRRTSLATIWAGLLVLAAADDAQVITRRIIKNTIMAVEEEQVICFGYNWEANSIDDADLARTVTVVPFMPLAAADNLSIHEVSASQSADPKWLYEFHYVETGHPMST